MNDLCIRYDATTIQQLFKIVTDDAVNKFKNKDVFPVSVIQAIYDGLTGTRLDQILALCNAIYLPFNGTTEDTRLQVGIDMRRKGLIVTFRDLNNYTWTQRYKGEDSISDEAWKADENWEAWDFDSLLEDIKKIIQEIFENFKDYPDLVEIINNSIEEIVNNYFESGNFDETIMEILNKIVPQYIQEAVNNYFNSEEGATTIKNYIKEVLDDVIGEYITELQTAIKDNERVTANALARHEMAITELQNK